MSERIKPTISGSAETMLQSFYARAQYSKSKHNKFYDAKAVELVDKIDYDFSTAARDSTMGKGVIARTVVFDELVKKAKELGISIIMDLVVNHCSSEHVWFKKAIADKNSPYRDYFYFRQGKADGTPPDNLRSYFGGSVWEKVPNEDNTYYLHYFAKEQPDLNWYNPKVREEIYAMMNRWFERGIDGFRVDAIMNIDVMNQITILNQ